MCIIHKRKISPAFLSIGAIIFAIASYWFSFSLGISLGLFLSEVFMKFFKCLSLPLISLSIITTITSHFHSQQFSFIWKKTLLWTVLTTLIAAAIAGGVYFVIDPFSTQKVALVLGHENDLITNQRYTEYLLEVVPDSFLAPFIHHQVIGVLLLSFTLGISIIRLQDSNRQKILVDFFAGLYDILMWMVGLLIQLIPLALYGFIMQILVTTEGHFPSSALGGYLGAVILSNIIQGTIILPLILLSHNINPILVFMNSAGALLSAFLTKSSVATLPITMQTAEKKLNIDSALSKFVLPLCTTINMNGCAAFITGTMLFVLQSYGYHISYIELLGIIMLASIAAIGNAGVPMGCFFLSASLLSSMNIPITLMATILPFYAIIDMVETALNVWSDLTVTMIVDQNLKNQNASLNC